VQKEFEEFEKFEEIEEFKNFEEFDDKNRKLLDRYGEVFDSDGFFVQHGYNREFDFEEFDFNFEEDREAKIINSE
jgi:hypothetical protein